MQRFTQSSSVIERVFALAAALTCPVYLLWQALKVFTHPAEAPEMMGLHIFSVSVLAVIWGLCVLAVRRQSGVHRIPVYAAIYLTTVVVWALLAGADLVMPGSPYVPAVFIGLMLLAIAGERRWPYWVCWGNCALLAAASLGDGVVMAFASMLFPLIVGTSLLVALRALLLFEQSVQNAEREARSSALDTGDQSLRLLEQAHWDAVVHDNVINVLRAASTVSSGREPRWLAAEATKAVQLLTSRPYDDDQSPGDFDRRLRTLTQEVSPGCTFRSTVERERPALPREVCQGILGATLEALRNVERHSQASVCAVDAYVSGNAVRVRIEDDGVGFDERKVPGTCMGLAGSVKGRMNLIGAEATIRSAPGEGTSIMLQWERSP